MTGTPSLVVATTTFQTTARGVEEWITAGQIAEAGAWPVKHFPDAFAPLKVDYFANPTRQQASDAQTANSVSPAALKHRGGNRRSPELPA
jgi:hypothetical protein